MRIDRIELKRFLAFEEASVDLGGGLVVVLAPNEGGKSTLLRGILASLFLDASSRSREVRALQRWGASDLPVVSVRLFLGGERYRLVRDFQAKEQLLFRGEEEEPLRRGKGVDEFLRERIPLAEEQDFMRVCGVRHEELASVSDGRTTLGEAIERLIAGGSGEESPSAIRALCESKRKDLLRGTGHQPAKPENFGPLRRFADAVEEAERGFETSLAAQEERERIMRSLSRMERERGELREQASVLAERAQRARRYDEVVKGEEELRKRAGEMTARIERLRDLLGRRERLASELRAAPEPLRAAGALTLEEWSRALERESILSRELESAEAPVPRSPAWRYAAAAALVAAGVIGVSLSRALAVPAALAALIGIAWLVSLARRKSARPEVAGVHKARSAALEALVEGRRAWAGARSIDEARRLLGDVKALAARMVEVEARLEEAAGGARADYLDLLGRLDRECTNAALSLRALAKDREDLERFRLEPADVIGIEWDHAERIEKEAALGREAAQLERRLAGLSPGDPAGIRERLEEARGELARARRRVEVVEAVIEGLDEARGRMAGFLSRRLPPIAGDLLVRLTGERYRGLSIDPVRLVVRVNPAPGGPPPAPGGPVPESVDPDALSQGTRDQIHLALRLALVDLLGGAEPLPLLLDDPLVHFDPERRARGVEILGHFAERHQVVLFTCDPFYETIGARVVRLAV